MRFLVVGGYAVALHGHPRYTKDLDIWLWLDRQNALQVVAALEQFDFGSLGLTSEDFLVADQIVQLGYPPNRIDLLTSLPGVEFSECYRDRVVVEIDGVLVTYYRSACLRKRLHHDTKSLWRDRLCAWLAWRPS